MGVAKPLVDEAITTILIICPGASMLFYRAALHGHGRTASAAWSGLTRAAESGSAFAARLLSAWRRARAGSPVSADFRV